MAATVEIIPAISLREPQGDFRNSTFTDFSREDNVRAMRDALRKVHSELGREYDLVIGGKMVTTKDKIKSVNPAKPSEIVGIHQKAGAEHVEPAIQAALKAFEFWRRTSWQERASLLLNASAIIQQRRLEFNAWMVYEVGKNWVEADADTGETIDFLEFYAREALRLSQSMAPVQLPGERDHLQYIPLGVGAVIPPWNFPCAIMAGMTSAAIVCGNTVILKPSSDSPTIAAKFFEVLQEAGMPDGVVNFCPGAGGTFGNALVEHPKTRFIAFTGSKEVGLDINARAAQPRKGQLWI
jgi:1-pyrroline-5-carboxylate dehydrogenase